MKCDHDEIFQQLSYVFEFSYLYRFILISSCISYEFDMFNLSY